MFLLSSADFLQNRVFKNKPPRTTIRVSNSLDPDQNGHFIGLHLGSKCLQKPCANPGIFVRGGPGQSDKKKL